MTHVARSAAQGPSGLHAAVWHAHALADAPAPVLPTGYAALDAELPGGGWPLGALTEVLQPVGVHQEWRLLLPALARSGSAAVVLVGAPHLPMAASLAARGLAASRLLGVKAQSDSQRLWATEQALRCADVDAVLLWLDAGMAVRPDALRRLQMAAADFAKLLLVMRPSEAQVEASPASLRLEVRPLPQIAGMQLRLLKRRGPVRDAPLLLRGHDARLSDLLVASAAASAGSGTVGQGQAWPQPGQLMPAPIKGPVHIRAISHALDRTAGGLRERT